MVCFKSWYTILMKIKYTDLYQKINVALPEFKFFNSFKRNVFQEVPDHIAKKLLENNFFISETDTIFTHEIFKKEKVKIGFFRYGAMGDLIQLLPIARYFKKTYPNLELHLICDLRFCDIFKREKDAYDKVLSKLEFHKNEYDKIIYLDGVLENDHSLVNNDRNYHRVKLYELFFNISLQEYDFHITFNEKEMNNVMKVIGD